MLLYHDAGFAMKAGWCFTYWSTIFLSTILATDGVIVGGDGDGKGREEYYGDKRRLYGEQFGVKYGGEHAKLAGRK